MEKKHVYSINIKWIGTKGVGTKDYLSYERSHVISVKGKNEIEASSDPAFRGDNSKYNPEELLVASLSSCHMLWYLHLCAVEGIIVTGYTDNAIGTMIETPLGSGYFSEVILYPIVTITDQSMEEKAIELHDKAHQFCFIANSVNFPIKHNAIFLY